MVHSSYTSYHHSIRCACGKVAVGEVDGVFYCEDCMKDLFGDVVKVNF